MDMSRQKEAADNIRKGGGVLANVKDIFPPETELDLEKTAIERIRTASQMSLQHYGLPLVVTDSGGKDSAVCRELVRRSGVPFS